MARLRKAAGNGIIPNLYYASLLNPKKYQLKKVNRVKKPIGIGLSRGNGNRWSTQAQHKKKEQEKKRKSDADLRRTLGMARAWPKIQETVERTVGRMRPAHFPRPPNESRQFVRVSSIRLLFCVSFQSFFSSLVLILSPAFTQYFLLAGHLWYFIARFVSDYSSFISQNAI